MAEAIFKQTLTIDCHINSAGLHALEGYRPDPTAIQLMQEKGIDISKYQATQLNQTIIRKSDLILVMEKNQKEMIEHKEPSAKGRVFRLGEWGEFDVADPYKQQRKAFEDALQLIEQGVNEWVKRI